MSAPSAFARKPSCVSPDTAPAGRGGSQKDEVKAASRAAHHREEVTQPTAQAALSCRARAELGSPRSRPPAVYAPGARGTRGRGGSRVSCPRVPRPERKGPTDPRRPRRRRSGAARPEREKPYSAAHAGLSESRHPLPAEGASTPPNPPKNSARSEQPPDTRGAHHRVCGRDQTAPTRWRMGLSTPRIRAPLRDLPLF